MVIKCYHCQVKGNNFATPNDRPWHTFTFSRRRDFFWLDPPRQPSSFWATNSKVVSSYNATTTRPTPDTPQLAPKGGGHSHSPHVPIVGCRRCVKGKMNGRWG